MAIAARQGAHERRCGIFQPALLIRITFVSRGALLQPLPSREIKSSRDRELAAPRFTLQACLELVRYSPTIDLGLHVLHCSAPRIESANERSKTCHIRIPTV